VGDLVAQQLRLASVVGEELNGATRTQRATAMLYRVPTWVWFVVFFSALFASVKFHELSVKTALWFAVLVPSVIAHEVAHGVVAYWCGDETAQRAGRLTANPLKHVSVFGTLFLPFILIVTAGTAFGFAKPVPVDLSATRNPRRDSLLISLAGPGVNLAIAGACYFIARVADVPGIIIDHYYVSGTQLPLWMQALFLLGMSNLWLAIFNLMPIPPLDGSAIIERMLPNRALRGYFIVRRFSLPLVFVFVYFVPGPLGWLLDHVWTFWWERFFG
jgi:Zn-dependent protease